MRSFKRQVFTIGSQTMSSGASASHAVSMALLNHEVYTTSSLMPCAAINAPASEASRLPSGAKGASSHPVKSPNLLWVVLPCLMMTSNGGGSGSPGRAFLRCLLCRRFRRVANTASALPGDGSGVSSEPARSAKTRLRLSRVANDLSRGVSSASPDTGASSSSPVLRFSSLARAVRSNPRSSRNSPEITSDSPFTTFSSLLTCSKR
mmetsp:Transcript_2632/g.7622  ORF Transcript_2632/g.7622 Transcript_2632/m.7622 type:complete len:206 (+) Transcript_2632:718-1335(+)